MEKRAFQTLAQPETFRRIITRNNGMAEIFHYIESIAKTDKPVLITGETGVGKELVSRAIHDAGGFSGKFVAVNVAGLDDNVFTDTLFGHVKGAFTGADTTRPGLVEQAEGGTLFLDEIGDLSPQSQVKLLRLLQEREYFTLGSDTPKITDARILAATNEDLWALQRVGKFRKDLNYRLRTPHHINVPPLRERKDDIEPLVAHFIREAAKTLNRNEPKAPKSLIEILSKYRFPGNVRELQGMVFNAVSVNEDAALLPDVFVTHIERDRSEPRGPAETADSGELLRFSDRLPTLKQTVQLLVAEALRRADGNQTRAARLLGISQPALSRRLKTENAKAIP